MPIKSLGYTEIMDEYLKRFKAPKGEADRRANATKKTLAKVNEAQKNYNEWAALVEELKADFEASDIQ
jgi:hypothetical protein